MTKQEAINWLENIYHKTNERAQLKAKKMIFLLEELEIAKEENQKQIDALIERIESLLND